MPDHVRTPVGPPAPPVTGDPRPAVPAARTPRRRLRSLFWPGFALGFLLLAMLSCGGMVMATGASRIRLADFQDNQVAWTPPPVTPTPAVEQPSDQEVVETDGGLYGPGDVVRNITSSQVNIRAVPGYLGKPDGDVLAQVPPGGTVEILGGRALADNLNWWRIRYIAPDGGMIEGWIAEATASGVQILGQ